MSYVFELRVFFILWIDEMLNLSHLELSNSDKPVSRSDFISKSKSDLSSSEGKSSSIELG